MIDRLFALARYRTSIRTEVFGGLTTFATMAYIIFVQPAVLTGIAVGTETGMDFGAVTTATCLAAALATALMGAYARYPIGLAPGMGQNFFFVVTAIPVAAAAGSTDPWRAALGAVFLAGLIFLLLSVLGIREKLLHAVSASMKHAMAVGIGLFVALIGLRNAGVVVPDPGGAMRMNASMVSPDIAVFAVGFVVTAVLHGRRVRGAILWGIGAALGSALVSRAIVPFLPDRIASAPSVAGSRLVTDFAPATDLVSLPPSVAPTFFAMDLTGAVTLTMLPIVILFVFMDVFDSMGTLIGVTQRAGLLQDGRLPRIERAMLADAVGTVAGAALGTSTVTSYVESASGVEAGARTGLAALVVAALFVGTLFFYPVVAMIGSYPPVTASALVVVGALMATNVGQIAWTDATEGVPAFLTIIGVPFFFSIADGLAVGLMVYPVLKTLSGHGRDVRRSMWWVAGLLAAYVWVLRPVVLG